MKPSLLLGIALLLVLPSCEKSTFNADYDVLLKTQSGLRLRYSDFELYDSSTHIFYLKNYRPELFTENNDKFSILADGETVYQGTIVAPYSCSIPPGPFIFALGSFGQNYFFKIESWFPSNSQDLRNDLRLINSLEKHGLFHSGLKVTIDTLEIENTQLKFKFTVTNTDVSNLLIFDLDKMDANLFHYFTNGLSLFDSEHNQIFESTIPYASPGSYRAWSITWLSVIKSGVSRQFIINYPLDTSLSPGAYHASFEFPGLYFQITHDQLYQNSDRIWLGDIQVNKNINVE